MSLFDNIGIGPKNIIKKWADKNLTIDDYIINETNNEFYINIYAARELKWNVPFFNLPSFVRIMDTEIRILNDNVAYEFKKLVYDVDDYGYSNIFNKDKMCLYFNEKQYPWLKKISFQDYYSKGPNFDPAARLTSSSYESTPRIIAKQFDGSWISRGYSVMDAEAIENKWYVDATLENQYHNDVNIFNNEI